MVVVTLYVRWRRATRGLSTRRKVHLNQVVTVTRWVSTWPYDSSIWPKSTRWIFVQAKTLLKTLRYAFSFNVNFKAIATFSYKKCTIKPHVIKPLYYNIHVFISKNTNTSSDKSEFLEIFVFIEQLRKSWTLDQLDIAASLSYFRSCICKNYNT